MEKKAGLLMVLQEALIQYRIHQVTTQERSQLLLFSDSWLEQTSSLIQEQRRILALF